MSQTLLPCLRLLCAVSDSFGKEQWGGSVATERLRREVDLLFELQLIEPATPTPYCLTALGRLLVDRHFAVSRLHDTVTRRRRRASQQLDRT